MSANDKNSWESEFSSFITKKDSFGLVSVSGKYRYNSSIYSFSLNRQSSGSYLYRGSIRVIGKSGKVLKKKNRSNNAKPELGPLIPQKDLEYKRVSTNIYSNSDSIEDIKEVIKNGVIRLYSENASLIGSDLSLSIRPDSITPAVAAQSKAERYVALAHKNASPETQHIVVKRIKKVCAKLPNIPMAKFKKTTLTKWLDDINAGRDTRKDLAGFWSYCCELGICSGTCPVDVPPTKRKSAVAKQKDVTRFDVMTLEQQDVLYAECRKKCSGPDVGKALMLGAGLRPKDIEKLCWKDIIFHKEYDFVTVLVIVDRLSGATHNYSRPIAPQAAEIVHKRYDTLLQTYSEKKLSEMPVVSLKTNPEKRMKDAALIQEATKTLQILFKVSYATLDLLRSENADMAAASRVFFNSYKQNLFAICNLNSDTGSATFLQSKSFGADPSNDNYISYSDIYGQRRLYYLMKILGENRTLKKPSDTFDESGTLIRAYTPETTRSYINLSCDIVINPGEEIEIECLHGVKGFVQAYQISESGRKKQITDQLQMELI